MLWCCVWKNKIKNVDNKKKVFKAADERAVLRINRLYRPPVWTLISLSLYYISLWLSFLVWTGLKALSTLRRFRLKMHPFPSYSIFVKENRAFWKRSPKWISLKTPFLRRSVDCWKFFESFACCVLFLFTLLLKICYIVHSSYYSPAKMTEHFLQIPVLQQNIRAVCILDQTYNGTCIMSVPSVSSQWTFMRVFTQANVRRM